jgi:hypothetical protein
MTPSRPRHRRARQPRSYQIVVRGELSQRFAMVFDGMDLEARDGQTVISGPVIDQAHLHGLLDRVRDLGLELVSVSPTYPRASATGTGDGA